MSAHQNLPEKIMQSYFNGMEKLYEFATFAVTTLWEARGDDEYPRLAKEIRAKLPWDAAVTEDYKAMLNQWDSLMKDLECGKVLPKQAEAKLQEITMQMQGVLVEMLELEFIKTN